MKIIKSFYIQKYEDRYEFYEDDKLISCLEVMDPYEYTHTDPRNYLLNIRRQCRQENKVYIEEIYDNEKLSSVIHFKGIHYHCETGPAVINYDNDGSIYSYTHIWNGAVVDFPLPIRTMEDRTVFMQNAHILK